MPFQPQLSGNAAPCSLLDAPVAQESALGIRALPADQPGDPGQKRHLSVFCCKQQESHKSEIETPGPFPEDDMDRDFLSF